MRIVIVEDETKIRMGLAGLIEKLTGQAITGSAKNGAEGLELCRRFKPDWIITDVRMPEMSGIAMLAQLKQEGLMRKATILSGYAEFEYAKQAIALGVRDYLLKPITVEDVKKALKTIDEEIQRENAVSTPQPVRVLRNYLQEEDAQAEAALRLAEQTCRFARNEPILACLGYWDSAQANFYERFEERMRILSQVSIRESWLYFLHDRMIVVIAFGFSPESRHAVEESFSKKVLEPLQPCGPSAWNIGFFSGLSALKKAMAAIRSELCWCIPLGYYPAICHDCLDDRKTQPLLYPEKLEAQIKAAVCSFNGDAVQKLLEQFFHILCKPLYSPDDIINAHVRLVTAVLNGLKDLDERAYQQILQQKLLSRVTTAVTPDELRLVLDDMLRLIFSAQEKKDDIRNYTISRALAYIRRHYMEGITLERVAARLDITPEYLSTLFNREVGKNFTLFLKEFRISHAKRLLRGSDLKIYEIAANVGYNDPKYFYRVFKEVTGLSPGDFRENG